MDFQFLPVKYWASTGLILFHGSWTPWVFTEQPASISCYEATNQGWIWNRQKEGGIRETVISRTAQGRLSQQYSVLSEYSPFFSPHAALAAVALSQGAAYTTSH